MTRIPYPDPAQQSAKVRAHVERAGLNVTRMMSHASESVFEGFGQLSSAFYLGSKLDPVLREVAILRVGHLSKSAYEIYHHEALAHKVGLTDEQIAAIERGGTDPVLSEAQRAVAAFADDIVLNVRAGDPTLAAIRKVLTDTEVMDLILVIGAYMTIGRMLETAGVEMEHDPYHWKLSEPDGPDSPT